MVFRYKYILLRPMHCASCGSNFQGREWLLLLLYLLTNFTTFPGKTRCARADVVIRLVQWDAGTTISAGETRTWTLKSVFCVISHDLSERTQGAVSEGLFG